MAARRAARRRARGGEDVPAPRQARARLATAGGALALAGALGAWPALDVREAVAWGALAAAALALLLLALGLAAGWAGAVWSAVAVLGAEYGAVLALEDRPLDGRATIMAAGLLLLAELASWSLEARTAVTEEPGASFARLAFLLALAGGALLAGAGVLALVDVAAQDGLAFELAGALAAAAALGLLLLAARRSGGDEERP